MNFNNLIQVACRALLLNKVRAFLTMLGIIIGVASVITMLAIGEGSKESIKGNLSSMGSNMINIRPASIRTGGVRTSEIKQTLVMKDLEMIKKEVNNVIAISPQATSGGQSIYGANNWPTTIYGVNSDYLKIRGLSVDEGTMFSDDDYKASAKVVVIGRTITDNLFPDGEDPIGKIVRFNQIPFKIIGILERKGENTFGQDQDNLLITPYTTLQTRILAKPYLQGIILSASTEEVSEKVVEDVTKLLRTMHKLPNEQDDDFEIFSQQELISMVSSTSNILSALLVSIAAISLFVGGIGIMNIMYVSVKERTREIGLRMAVGAKGNDILLQFLVEAILISITGGVIGVTLGIGLSFSISHFFDWPTNVSIVSIIISFIVCTITGIFFGWYPAKKAAQLDPIDALRYE